MSHLPPRQVAGTPALNGPHGNSVTTISQQDSTHFGLPIARNPHLTREGIEAADAFCRRENVALFIVRCPTTDTNSLLGLQDNGYRIVDTLVHWRCRRAR